MREAYNHGLDDLLMNDYLGLLDNGERADMSVAVGDEVIYGKYGGTDIEVNGDEVKILRESDILAKVIE
jgi:chaperonin GroES